MSHHLLHGTTLAILVAGVSVDGGPLQMTQAHAGPIVQVQQSSDRLSSLEGDVDGWYPTVDHLQADAMQSLINRNDQLVVFDVREKDEFAVSHLPGAIQVDPGVWTSSFMRRYADMTKGKTVVFYCSVGVRSSKLAQRVQEQLKEQGALRVHNLRGGVFRWHNDRRVLHDTSGTTAFVHPYDETWGQYLNRQKLKRYRTPQ